MRRLSSLDAQFLAAERGNFGSQYCGLGIYETEGYESINAATMTQLLSERIDQCAPLRWKVVTVPLGLDHPVFIDTDVNLEDHVSETTLPAPADDATVAAEVASILSTPLDRDKPLWRLRVIHGLPGRTAVVITLHHAAADGIAASEIFAALLDIDSPEPSTTKVPSKVQSDPVPNRVALADWRIWIKCPRCGHCPECTLCPGSPGQTSAVSAWTRPEHGLTPSFPPPARSRSAPSR
jgi:hypothetical protein